MIAEDQSEAEETIRKIPKISVSHDRNLDTIHNYECLSLERPPNIDFYRMTIQKAARPSVAELIHGKESKANLSVSDMKQRLPSNESRRDIEMEAGIEPLSLKTQKLKEKPLGWFMGVYVPAFTNIVGTLLYLRMGYVVGQSGICKFRV